MKGVPLSILVGAAALAACDGNHTLGLTEDDLTLCCVNQTSNRKVPSCVGLSNCTCNPSLCGAGPMCKTSADCPKLGIPCVTCADGTSACPQVDCVNGQCKASVHSCAAQPCSSDAQCAVPQVCEVCADGSCAGYKATCVSGQCKIDKQPCASAPQCIPPPPPKVCPGLGCFPNCPNGILKDANGCDTCQCATTPQPVPPTPTPPPAPTCVAPHSCQLCTDGSTVCASAKCDVNGVCTVYYPPCPPPPPNGCVTDADCPKLGVACQVCPDGTTTCPKVWCARGMCVGAAAGCSSPPPGGCAVDSDCSTFSNLCAPSCTCQAHNKTDPVVQCTMPSMCVADPCLGHTAYCDPSSKTCALK
jgi:hypothetical protein